MMTELRVGDLLEYNAINSQESLIALVLDTYETKYGGRIEVIFIPCVDGHEQTVIFSKIYLTFSSTLLAETNEQACKPRT